MVCFRLDESLVLDKVEELRPDRDAVPGLPLVSFIARNRLSRGRLAGRRALSFAGLGFKEAWQVHHAMPDP